MVTRGFAGLAGALLLGLAGCSGAAERELASGSWRAWLDSPGGELPFGLELVEERGVWQAFLINGEERIGVERVERWGGQLVLGLDRYDATLVGQIGDGGRRLEGEWRKTSGPDRASRLPFHASHGSRPRFARTSPADPTALARVAGRWAVEFASDDQPAVGLLETRDDGTVLGTFMTTTGDYRFLEGTLDGDRLRLSCFDGAHAFLFDARVGLDGELVGDFWSRDTWHEGWTARRDEAASLPDAFELTRWIEGQDLRRLSFPDLDGTPRSLDDPRFAGSVRILEIFGSWCPNCNDAIPHLVELDEEYRDRGLSIVGLAFEMTGDFARDAEQVRRYAGFHGVTFPLLIAGLSDKAAASEAFPLVDRVRAFPTTIFLDARGRARAVHQGFAGPATGPAHDELRARFRRIIEELLAEAGAEGARDRRAP